MHCLLPSRGNSTNPERPPACNRRRSNSCKPSASFLPASVGAKRHLVNTRPRTPVADFAPRGRAATDRIMSACQRPWVSDIMMATSTAPSSRSRRDFRLRVAEDQTPGRDHDQCSHLENLERCRDPLVCKQLGWSKTSSIVCCSTRRSTQRSRTHGAKMSGRGGYEEKKWTLCDG